MEVTGSQSVSFVYSGVATTRPDYAQVGTLTELRAVRRDPTVSLARRLLISTIQSGSWSLESEDEKMVEDMSYLLGSLRDTIIYNAVAFGLSDYGWIGFEKLFGVRDDKIVLEELKPLLHDITTILVTPSGRFNGLRQRPLQGAEVDVEADKCLHIAFGVEAGNLYGLPLLEGIRATTDSWAECDAGARRYDTKLAGSHWVVYYPPGTSVIDGVSTDNGEVAALILAAMESSGSAAMPTTSATVLQEVLNQSIADLYAWRVELITDEGGKQASFNDRLNYLDRQKVRGMGLPERAILEGEHGTKAEAKTHGDWAVLSLEAIDRSIAAQVNTQVVNQLVAVNYGENAAELKIVPTPLVDPQVTFLRELYLDQKDTKLDVDALASRLDLPRGDEHEVSEDE